MALLALTGCMGEAQLQWAGSDGLPDSHPEPTGPGRTPTVCEPGERLPVSRFQRLTTSQYQNSVQALLGVRANTTFAEDPNETGFDTSHGLLSVGVRQASDYQSSAEQLAAAVVADPALFSGVVPCSPAQGGSCARTFVESIGLRLFRRPLEAPEVDTYLQLHTAAAALYTEGDPFQRGVRLVLEAMLQAPDFLYRVELGTDADGDGVIPLNGYERATRLAYSLWNSAPDDALLAAAAEGRLDQPAGVKAEAERMVGDARARAVFTAFHHQWLRADRYPHLTRDPSVHPAFTPALLPDLTAELHRFVLDVVVDRRANFETLLTEPATFANERLGLIYGVDVAGDALRPVGLPPDQRAGLLTQIGFLAAGAHGGSTDPIRRGTFVLEHLLCMPMGAPPPDATMVTPPDFGPEVRTTRDRVSVQTGARSCQGCHRLINAAGFAFENYDSVGAWRTTERGAPVDASGVFPIDGVEVHFSNAVELLAAASKSTSARRCYTAHWLRFVYGRIEDKAERCDVEQLATAMERPDYPVQNLLVDLTQTSSFLNRFGDVR